MAALSHLNHDVEGVPASRGEFKDLYVSNQLSNVVFGFGKDKKNCLVNLGVRSLQEPHGSQHWSDYMM